MLSETHVSEEKAKKAMIDAARLADELRMEQENAQVRRHPGINKQDITYDVSYI